jgi:ankyrin repeat protein
VPENNSHAGRVATFLRLASLDWRVGGPDRARHTHAAARLLARHPEIAGADIYTAVVCGDAERVARILAERPRAPAEPGGPRDWPPLLYLCNARLPPPWTGENAVAIAQMLLDRGADPNAFYPGGNPSIRYSALTALLGRGEEQATLHPQAEALARRLLEHGAEPYDIQALYNVFGGHASQRHLGGEALWLMELIYTHSVARGRAADWKDPNWPMLDMGGYGCGARYLLASAIGAHHARLAEWLLAHGANPNAPPAADARLFQGSLYEEALRRGRQAIAKLLLRYGASPATAALDGEDVFAAACLRLDRDVAQQLAAACPEYLQSTRAIFAAGELDQVEAVKLLLDLGVSPDLEQPQTRLRPLHHAAYYGALRVAALLVERGAELDFMDNAWESSPIGAAFWGQQPAMVELLAPLSRDVWTLVSAGKVERLREVLAAEPRLAKVTYQNCSPLFWLPDEEASAVAIVELFLAHGADASLRDAAGLTAADHAAQRGLEKAARLCAGAS